MFPSSFEAILLEPKIKADEGGGNMLHVCAREGMQLYNIVAGNTHSRTTGSLEDNIKMDNMRMKH
jgi:hypothetical protein